MRCALKRRNESWRPMTKTTAHAKVKATMWLPSRMKGARLKTPCCYSRFWITPRKSDRVEGPGLTYPRSDSTKSGAENSSRSSIFSPAPTNRAGRFSSCATVSRTYCTVFAFNSTPTSRTSLVNAAGNARE